MGKLTLIQRTLNQPQYTFPGKDEPKAPTLHIKPKEPKSFVTPSPGAYNPDAADKDVKISAPKYSFGIKTKDGKPREVPAPNAYTIAKVRSYLLFRYF